MLLDSLRDVASGTGGEAAGKSAGPGKSVSFVDATFGGKLESQVDAGKPSIFLFWRQNCYALSLLFLLIPFLRGDSGASTFQVYLAHEKQR